MHALAGKRRAELAQAFGREGARHDHGIGLLDQPPLPECQRGAICERLGQAPAAVEADPRQRVAAMAAGALLAAREAHADGADEAVLVQMEDDPRASGARRRERAPTERRMHVVRVHHPCSGEPHRSRHVAGGQPAAEQAGRGVPATQRRRVPGQQLRGLAHVLAHEPQQILDDALLAACGAVTVV